MLDTFFNRSVELEDVKDNYKKSKIYLIRTEHRIGSTWFMEKLGEVIGNSNTKVMYISLTCDTEQIETRIVNGLLNDKYDFAFSKPQRDLINAVIKNDIPDSLINEIIKDVPYVGNSLSTVYSKISNRTIRKICNEKNRFIGVLEHICIDSKFSSFVIIIDNISCITENNLKEIFELISNTPNLYLIASVYNESLGDYEKYNRMAKQILKKNIYCQNLKKPDYDMLKQINYGLSLNLSDKEINDILTTSHNDMFTIREKMENSTAYQQTPLDKEIMAYLGLIKVEIDLSILYQLLHFKERYLFEDTEINDSIQKLNKMNYIKLKNDKCIINLNFTESEKTFKRLFRIKTILDCCEKKESQLDINLLRRIIVLGNEVYPNDQHKLYVFYNQLAVLEIKSNQLTLNPWELDLAFYDLSSYEQVKYKAISYFMLYKFDKAYDLLQNNMHMVKISNDLSLLWAISLNRTRRVQKAEEVLLELTNKKTSINYKCIVLCYLIINYIYLEDFSKAKRIYRDNEDFMQKSDYFGYLLRNSITAISNHDNELSIKLLSEYIKNQTINDNYLKGTIENNIGRVYLAQKNTSLAKQHFEAADGLLKDYRKENLAILYNNLAILYFLEDNLDEAINFIEMAKNQSIEFMQHQFILLNASVIYFSEDSNRSYEILNSIEEQITNYPIKRMKEVYYSTRCLIEAFSLDNKLDYYLKELKKYPDSLRLNKTYSNIKIYEKILNKEITLDKQIWKELYVPVYLVYWYVNPLNIIDY